MRDASGVLRPALSPRPIMSQAASPYRWRSFQLTPMRPVSGGVETLGRAGHFAKGLIYTIVGLTTLASTFGYASDPAGSTDAIRKIGEQPFGRFLLGAMAVGLFGYVVWRFVQAFKDTEAVGDDAKGLAKRFGYAFSGAVYLTLAGLAASLALGLNASSGGGSGGGAEEQAKSSLLASPGGPWILGIIGVVVVGVGIYMMVKGWKAKFMEKYDLARMSEKAREVALHVGRTGYLARGLAMAIVGGFVVRTAMGGGRGGEFAGIEDAIRWLGQQPFGPFLVGTVGFGLACFGVHAMLLGYYRRFNVDDRASV